MNDQQYFGKILLYGEYTIMYGSEALAIPSKEFYGQWQLSNQRDERLVQLVEWLTRNPSVDYLDLDRMSFEVDGGLIFSSNIPQGYGLGSSGTLTAGIYDRYSAEPVSSLDVLRTRLSEIEGYFHGSSSGLDPLVSLLNQPIHVTAEGPRPIESNFEHINDLFFLLDSGLERTTSEYVTRFKAEMERPDFEKFVLFQWKPLVKECIHAHLSGDTQKLKISIAQISRWMWEEMRLFIPASHLELWEKSLDDDGYSLKLCGAGGGGMTLGFGKSPLAVSR